MITEAEVLAALPPLKHCFLSRYVKYAMEVTDSHAGYHLGAGLCLLAQSIPIHCYAPWASELWGNVFTLLVGISSDSRKTEAIKLMKRVLHMAETNAQGEQGVSCVGLEPGSEEALVDGVIRMPRQVLCFSEFGNFLASTKNSYKTPVKTRLNDLADGSAVSRDTVKGQREKKPMICNTPRVSVIGGVTPDYLEHHTELHDWTGGFFARFIMFHATRQRLIPIPDVDVWPEERQALVDTLRNRRFEVGVPTLGRCLGFSGQRENKAAGIKATGACKLWMDWVEGNDAKKDVPSEVRSAYSRAQPHAVRMAFLIAADAYVQRGPDKLPTGEPWYITEEPLHYAIKIAELHVKSIASIWLKLANSQYARSRRTVLESIDEKQPTRLGEIVRRSALDLKTVRNVLEGLAEEGFVQRSLAVLFRTMKQESYERTNVTVINNTVVDLDAEPPANGEGGKLLHLPTKPPPPAPVQSAAALAESNASNSSFSTTLDLD